jgi:hypothetical protein
MDEGTTLDKTHSCGRQVVSVAVRVGTQFAEALHMTHSMSERDGRVMSLCVRSVCIGGDQADKGRPRENPAPFLCVFERSRMGSGRR